MDAHLLDSNAIRTSTNLEKLNADKLEKLRNKLQRIHQGNIYEATKILTLQELESAIHEIRLKINEIDFRTTEVYEHILPEIERLYSLYTDFQTSPDISLKYAEILFEVYKEIYQKKIEDYKIVYDTYKRSREYKTYIEKLRKYYRDSTFLLDDDDSKKPIAPPVPPIPDTKVEKMISLYDKILATTQDKKFLAHALFAKAYLLGEGYGKFMEEEILRIPLESQRKQSILVLKELIKRFPNSSYSMEAYFLIAEYLFNSTKEQPQRSIEAIPYYHKAIQYSQKKGVKKEYYEMAIYKLAYCYLRINDVSEALNWFDKLMGIIENTEREYFDKPLPKGSMAQAKEEILNNIVECFQKKQDKLDKKKSASNLILNFYRNAVKGESRDYVPLIYLKLGNVYENNTEYEKVREIYTELLQRYPNFELAPYIVQKTLKILTLFSQNGEYKGKELEAIEEQLYKERERIFYRYGKNSTWYKNMVVKIADLKKGKYTGGIKFDESVLAVADELSRTALFQNIIISISIAQRYEGSENVSNTTGIGVDKKKMIEYYVIALRDIQNYIELTAPYYDDKTYFLEYQRALLTEQKFNKRKEAFEMYLKLASRREYDSLPSNYEIPNSPKFSYRNNVMKLAITIADSINKEQKTALYDPKIFTVNELPLDTLPFVESEKMFVRVLKLYIHLYPQDTLSLTSIDYLSKFFLFKGRMNEYKEVELLRMIYYPVGKQDMVTMALLSQRAFQVKEFENSISIAKGMNLYAAVIDTSEATRKYMTFANQMIGASISQKANQYAKERKYFLAAKEYERFIKEAPRHPEFMTAIINSSNLYDSVKAWKDAARMARVIVTRSEKWRDKVVGHSILLRVFDKDKQIDSLIHTMLEISHIYREDSLLLSKTYLFNAIRLSQQYERYDAALVASDEFITRFPNDERIYDIQLNKITIAQKKGDKKEAFRLYGVFADTYKDISVSVEAFFRRAEYAEEIKDSSLAMKEYQRVINRNDSLAKEKRIPRFASEAMYRMTKPLLRAFEQEPITIVFYDTDEKQSDSKKIKTKKPAPNDNVEKKPFEFDAKKKEELYKKIEANLLRIIKMGSHQLLSSYLYIEKISEDMATEYKRAAEELIVTSKKDKSLSEIKVAELVSKGRYEAAFFYNKTQSDNFTVAKNLSEQKRMIADSVQKSKSTDSKNHEFKSLTFDSASYTAIENLFSAYQKKNDANIYAMVDTFNLKAMQWIDKTNQKIPFLFLDKLIDIMVRYSKEKGIDNIMQSIFLKENVVKTYEELPVPDEIKKSTTMIGKGKNKSQIFLGDIAELQTLSTYVSNRIRPAVNEVIISYDSAIKNIQKNDNPISPLIESFNKKIYLMISKPISKMDSVLKMSMAYFLNYDKKFQQKITDVETKGKWGEKDIQDFVIYKIKLAGLIKIIDALTTSSLIEYSEAYKTLKKIKGTEKDVDKLVINITKFIYEKGRVYFELQKDFEKKRNGYNDNANKFVDKDWYGFAEKTYKPIQDYLTGLTQNVLSQSITVLTEYNFQNEYTNKALQLLVETDRKKYLSYLGSSARKDTVIQGGWKYVNKMKLDDDFEWYKKEYKDAEWMMAEGTFTRPLSYIAPRETDTTLADIHTRIFTEKATEKLLDTLKQDIKYQAGSVLNYPLSFDAKNKLSKGKKELEELASKAKGNAMMILECTFSKKGLEKLTKPKLMQQITARFTELQNVFVQLGMNKKQITLSKNELLTGDSSKIKILGIERGGSVADRVTESSEFLYFRTAFDFNEAINLAQLVLAKSMLIEKTEVYFNDIFIDVVQDKVIVSPDKKYFYDGTKQTIIDITDKIIRGKNVLAIKIPTQLNQIHTLISLNYYGEITKEQLKKLQKIYVDITKQNTKQRQQQLDKLEDEEKEK